MRALLIVALCAALLTVLPVYALDTPSDYRIEFDKSSQKVESLDTKDKKGIYVTVRFRLFVEDGVTPSPKDEIVVLEEGKEVWRQPVTKVLQQELTTVLALDVSASMGFNNKIGEAKTAAGVFLDMLGKRADIGLILFDHQVPVDDPNRFLKPSGNHSGNEKQAEAIRKLVEQAKPMGGSAYRDAAAKAVDMLAKVEGKKAVVLMTDGVDVNSHIHLGEVIKRASTIDVPIYTVSIGSPGLNAVLVLDQSGSMSAPANDTDSKPKIVALHEAGTKFVEAMRSGARATLLPFSTEVTTPEPFTTDKMKLIRQIRELQPKDGTSLYDATMAGIETLVAANFPDGSKVVVALTDGKDESPGSRYSDQAVIERAKETGVKLYMLGLGRKKEINEKVMINMARQTGGEYFHVTSAEELVRTFEKLSRDLGDFEALKELAEKTGGKYHHVSDISKLKFVFEQVAADVERDRLAEFKSVRDVHDGTARKIEIKVMRGGETISKSVLRTGDKTEEVTGLTYNVRGLVVPEQSALMYLVLLGCVIGCLALPPGLRRLMAKR